MCPILSHGRVSPGQPLIPCAHLPYLSRTRDRVGCHAQCCKSLSTSPLLLKQYSFVDGSDDGSKHIAAWNTDAATVNTIAVRLQRLFRLLEQIWEMGA